MIYLQLFLSFFKIGLFGFGGGLAILSLIQMEVEQNGWMTQQEFVDIVAVSQITPGPIGINCATYVGYTVGGIWGSVLATSAIVLPSLIIMLSICKAYFWLNRRFKGNPYFEQTLRMLRFTVLGLIASAALLLMKPTTFIDSTSWVIFGIVAFLTISPEIFRKKEGNKLSTFNSQLSTFLSHPILLIVLAGVAGYLIYR
ncbi:MAG: chromate transporter [Paludibacteraceae bacterium]|nr:chromate transporter [Paludibacteraceae bacterium]MBQ4017778.1 chromate transporter [Paludibacteraceae bacterium]